MKVSQCVKLLLKLSVFLQFFASHWKALKNVLGLHVESCTPHKVSWMFGVAIDDKTRTNPFFFRQDAGMFCLLAPPALLHKQNAQAVCTTDSVNKPPRGRCPTAALAVRPVAAGSYAQ